VREVAAGGLTAMAAMTLISSTVPGQDADGLRALALAELAAAAGLAHERTAPVWRSIKGWGRSLATRIYERFLISAEQQAKRNAFEVLWLTHNEPDFRKVKRARKRLLFYWHPDKPQNHPGFSKEYAQEMTHGILNAFNLLKQYYPEGRVVPVGGNKTDGGESD